MAELSKSKYIYLRDLFTNHTGIVFNDQLKLERLLTKRVIRLNLNCLDDYMKILSKDKNELINAIEAITINETFFFRNIDQFDVIKRYFSRAVGSAPFKIWSVATSTGQEPYSLAMLAYELGLKNVKIMGTDINKTVLDYAKEGIYSEIEIERTDPKYMPYIKKYTEKKGRNYAIKDCIKKMVTYKNLNLINISPSTFSTPLDMIICKNVFIYFNKETRDRLFSIFYKLLKKDGALFMGLCETLPTQFHEKFKTHQKATHIKL